MLTPLLLDNLDPHPGIDGAQSPTKYYSAAPVDAFRNRLVASRS